MQRNSSYDKRSRVNLIIDTLVGSVNYYPVSTLSIYPLIDIIKLLVQQPLLFAFFDEQLKLIYCTMEDPQYSKTVRYKFENSYLKSNLIHFNIACRDNEKSTPLASYRVAIFLQSFDDVPGSLEFNPPPKNILNQYIKLFSAIEKERDIAFALHTALKYIDDRSHRDLSHSNNPKCPAITIEHYNEMIYQLRSVFDEALGELSESPLLHNVPGNPGEPLPYPNIFFTVQNATIHRKETNFNYTAQVLLSHKQNVQIKEWCKTVPGRCSYSSCPSKQNKCPFKGPFEDPEKTFKEAIHNLEKPLGSSSRSISDSVYYSGSLEFTPRSIRQGIGHAGGSRDYSSKDMNMRDCIYAQFVDCSTKTLLIPIHIGGVPWIILNTFTSSDKNDANSSWKHNYHIYRTVTRSIATRLRTGVKQLYLDLVSSELEREKFYKHGMLAVDLLNERWEELSAVYPFDRVIITSETDSSRQSTCFIKSKHFSTGYYLHLVPNEWYQRQVLYSGIQLEDVHQACLNALKRADDTLNEVYKIFSEQVKQQAHTLGNILHPITLGLTNLQSAMLKPRLNKIKCHNKLAKISTLVDVWIVSFQILVGNKNEQPQMLAMVKTLRELLDWFVLRYTEANFGVIYHIESDVDAVLPDVAGAFTILWNFIENARNNSRTPPVELHAAKIAGGLIEIVIKNSGKMPESMAQKLLNSQAVYPSGIWKGFAVVQRKLVDMGWQLTDICVCDEGTSISIRLPTNIRKD